jgi:lipopolysaccharide/colanic/teichoic acid biosynthesis glycosyltransferase
VITRWGESRRKRIADVLLAGIGGLFISPLLFLCAMTVRGCDGPGILYRQARIGRGGRAFTILKFRTMRAGETGPLLTAAGDRRVTRVGSVLRRYKLDELPQLWNVVRGDMSLVGPRPELPAYVDQHPAVFRRLGQLRPGVTDWASLAFRNEEALLAEHSAWPEYYTTVLLPYKLALARLYRRHASASLDLRLVVATFFAACHMDRLMRALAGRPVCRAWGDVVRTRTSPDFPLQEITEQ